MGRNFFDVEENLYNKNVSDIFTDRLTESTAISTFSDVAKTLENTLKHLHRSYNTSRGDPAKERTLMLELQNVERQLKEIIQTDVVNTQTKSATKSNIPDPSSALIDAYEKRIKQYKTRFSTARDRALKAEENLRELSLQAIHFIEEIYSRIEKEDDVFTEVFGLAEEMLSMSRKFYKKRKVKTKKFKFENV